jgi:hypothetical protein
MGRLSAITAQLCSGARCPNQPRRDHACPLQSNHSKKFMISFGFVDAKYRKEDTYTACLRSRGRLIPCAGAAAARELADLCLGQISEGTLSGRLRAN